MVSRTVAEKFKNSTAIASPPGPRKKTHKSKHPDAIPIPRGPSPADTAPPSGDLFEDYLGEADAAREIRVSVKTLRKYRRLSIGPPFSVVARKYLYARPGLRTWLANGGTKGAEMGVLS